MIVLLAIPVSSPLQDVTEHIVQSEGVGCLETLETYWLESVSIRGELIAIFARVVVPELQGIQALPARIVPKPTGLIGGGA